MATWPYRGRSLRLSAAELGDIALAVTLGAFALTEVWVSDGYRGPESVNAALVVVMASALVWRRRAPIMVLSVVVGAIAVQSIAFGGSETGSLLLIALVAVYTSVAHGSQPLLAAVLALAGALVHDIFDPAIDTFAAHIYSPMAFGLALLFGFAMRRRQADSVASEERLEALKAEHELATRSAADERRLIARELHDIVAHSLGVMVLQAGAAEQVLESSPGQARHALQAIRRIGQESVDEMARLLGLIREDGPATLHPHPSLADLEALVDNAASAGLRIDLTIEGTRRELPTALELSAYRIVQEGITNVLKHAGVTEARVVIRYRDRELEVEVSDDSTNGTGTLRGGHGLIGLRERAAVFAGSLEAGPKAGGGWNLRATLPLER